MEQEYTSNNVASKFVVACWNDSVKSKRSKKCDDSDCDGDDNDGINNGDDGSDDTHLSGENVVTVSQSSSFSGFRSWSSSLFCSFLFLVLMPNPESFFVRVAICDRKN